MNGRRSSGRKSSTDSETFMVDIRLDARRVIVVRWCAAKEAELQLNVVVFPAQVAISATGDGRNGDGLLRMRRRCITYSCSSAVSSDCWLGGS